MAALTSHAASEGQLLWAPSRERKDAASISAFMRFVEARHGLHFDGDYNALWQWSVDRLDDFWVAVWDYFQVASDTPYTAVREGATMPGVRWFPGSSLNYAEHALRRGADDEAAILHLSERHAAQTVTRGQLRRDVRVAATRLRAMGIAPGDRIAAYLPNSYPAAVAFLATTAIGAVWSSAAPEFGVQTVVDRFTQIEPRLMFVGDGYQFGGKPFDRREHVQQLCNALPSTRQVVWVDVLGQECALTGPEVTTWSDFIAGDDPGEESFRFERVGCEHPLWIVYSSGTTGLPKPIVHSHVGVLLEVLTNLELQHDLRTGKRLFFYSTTGWIMWNLTMAGLVTGASIVLYDGHPAYPRPDMLFKLTDELDVTLTGASPTFVQMMQKAGIRPRDTYAFKHLDTVLVSGSPAQPETFAWFYEAVKEDVWVASSSGGTDIAGAFVAGCPLLPVHAGEIQCRALGHDVQSWSDAGQPVTDEVGELMCVQPLPSMPIGFWNDPGHQRYRESYFEAVPGVWKHGDFLKLNGRGGAYIYGRSDSTLNRHGVRIGTAEVYRAIEQVDGVADSLVVCCELEGGKFFMPLFVQLKAGVVLDEALEARMSQALRDACSPRHVPDRYYAVSAIPYTLTGKKMEVPVRKLLMGWPLAKAANVGAMANPASIDWFVQFAQTSTDYPRPAPRIG